MFQRVRKHLTPSTFIAFIALVFAITGGAFAASSNGGSGSTPAPTAKATASSTLASAAKSKSKSKSKTKVVKGPAGPKGATGATGAAGQAGAPGAKGENGAAGANGNAGSNGTDGEKGETGAAGKNGTSGTAGTDGKSVASTSFTGTSEPAGEPCKKAGGNSLEVEGSGTKHYACNGEPGNIGKTLAPGATETGTWVTKTDAEGEAPPVSISFAIPLEKALSGDRFHFITKEEVESGNIPIGCGGTVEKPEAENGYLCIFEGLNTGAGKAAGTAYLPYGTLGAGGAGTTGLFFATNSTTAEEVYLTGTWAVTGE